MKHQTFLGESTIRGLERVAFDHVRLAENS